MTTEQENFRIHLPDEARRDLTTLVARADDLPAFLAATKNLKPGISTSSVLDDLAKATNIDRTEVRNIFSALENLRLVKEKAAAGSAERAISVILSALGDDKLASEWTQKKAALADAVAAYTDDNPLAISRKAEKLSRFYERGVEEVEIITDVRPVFDHKGETILEFVITHVLAISDGVEDRRLHFSMDASDLLSLRRACERAVKKANTLKKALGDKAAWTVAIPRDSNELDT